MISTYPCQAVSQHARLGVLHVISGRGDVVDLPARSSPRVPSKARGASCERLGVRLIAAHPAVVNRVTISRVSRVVATAPDCHVGAIMVATVVTATAMMAARRRVVVAAAAGVMASARMVPAVRRVRAARRVAGVMAAAVVAGGVRVQHAARLQNRLRDGGAKAPAVTTRGSVRKYPYQTTRTILVQ